MAQALDRLEGAFALAILFAGHGDLMIGARRGSPLAIGYGALRKNKRINIRLPSHDLVEIKRLAAREGVPYQTLISSILHKYATGELG